MQKGTTKIKILKHDVMNDVSKLARKGGFGRGLVFKLPAHYQKFYAWSKCFWSP